MFDSPGKTFLYPLHLAELVFVSAHSNPAQSWFRRKSDPLRSICRAPWDTLINPRAQQSNLHWSQWLALPRRRHLHVLDQPGDVMDKRAFSALAGNDVNAVVTSLKR